MTANRPPVTNARAGAELDFPRDQGESRLSIVNRPRFTPVDRAGSLPDGTQYVLSYIEILGDSTVVRLHILDLEAVGRFAGPALGLRDDRGRDFEWRSSASGGMLPWEVLHEFTSRPSEQALSIDLYLRSNGFVLGTILLA